jgi:hypothetical protein
MQIHSMLSQQILDTPLMLSGLLEMQPNGLL